MSSPQAPPALPPPFWFAFEAFPAVTWGWFGALPLLMAEMTTPDDCTSPSPDAPPAPEYRAEMKRKIIICPINSPWTFLLHLLYQKKYFICISYLTSITTAVLWWLMSNVHRFTMQPHLLVCLQLTIAVYCVGDRLETTWTSDYWQFIRCSSLWVLQLMDTTTTNSTAVLANQSLTIGIAKDIQKVLHFQLPSRYSSLILLRICIINWESNHNVSTDLKRWAISERVKQREINLSRAIIFVIRALTEQMFLIDKQFSDCELWNANSSRTGAL